MHQKSHVLTILRHENSLRIVDEFCQTHGFEHTGIALDPIELPQDVAPALAAIAQSLQNANVNCLIVGTKVYDTNKEGPSLLGEFLTLLDQADVGQRPICLTHLHDFDTALEKIVADSGLNIVWVDNDNLKRDNMANLGPVVLKALNIQVSQ